MMGLDGPLERRRGAKIQAKGLFRDQVRSSHSYLVKARGLRWLSLMLLAPMPWAQRLWALLFMTVLAPSERSHQERSQRHQKLTDWARHMLLVVRRWVPERPLVLVTDRSFAVMTLLWQLSRLSILSVALPACGWMRPCRSLPHPASWGRLAGRASKVSGCPR
jgi:hypothetical protein